MVKVLVHVAGTKCQTGNAAAWLNLLQRVINHAHLHQTENAIGHRLGVKAKMFVVFQAVQNRVRNAADTDLKGGAVRDLGGDVRTDR